MVKDDQLALVKAAITGSLELTSEYGRLEANAQKLLAQPTLRLVGNGEASLSEIRRSENLMVTLAGLYRLDGDPRKVERVKKELLAASALGVWDSDNYLQTAELCYGVATAYDWIYNELSAEDRKTISQALIEKGLASGRMRFIRNFKWVSINTNWNPVCNGGLGVAALAVAEDAPTLSAEILDRAVDSIKISMAKYAPDGGDPEGPMYWNYGIIYNIYLVDALITTFGRDWGLEEIPGFAQTPRYGMAIIDPLSKRANTSDAEEGAGPCAEMFWFAREFRERAYYDYELRRCADHPSIRHLFWAINQPTSPPTVIAPDACFRAINVAVFRDNWTDRTASFAALKGGTNRANHAHLDLGSFILDAKGERWAVDLGSDNYDLPGYNGRDPRRWTYFRIGTRSHNTLILDGENQSLVAEARIVRFRDEPENKFAITDLSSTYPEKASSIRRGLRKVGSNFLVQDELELTKPTDVTWNFATRARVEPSNRTVELYQGKARLGLHILEPTGATFEVEPAPESPPQYDNPGVEMVQINLPHAFGKVRIVVAIEATALEGSDLTVMPLARW